MSDKSESRAEGGFLAAAGGLGVFALVAESNRDRANAAPVAALFGVISLLGFFALFFQRDKFRHDLRLLHLFFL